MENLANKMRPTQLNEIIGQNHLIGPNKILTNLVNNQHICSMILYGLPGTGKTSIANAIVQQLNIPYKFLNATINNKQDFDMAITEAKFNGGEIIIIDEIHRMNKDKQDLLLPYIESGLITLIGLTTANPYHKINPALRSRVQIFELHELSIDDILLGLNRACNYLDEIKIDDNTLSYIANLSSGDLRSAISLLEVAYYSTNDKSITIDTVKNICAKPIFFHDKNGDGHYDVLSALQKSIRGSDVDASIHYLARLLVAEDLDSIYRRLSVIVYEDIGLANPSLGPKLLAAIEASERVGLPEAIIPLGTIVTEMALSPKSNSASKAIEQAINDINKGTTGNVPDNIKTNSKTYLYPHNYPKSYVKQEYLPKQLNHKKYYQPKNNRYEMNLYKIYLEMRGEL